MTISPGMWFWVSSSRQAQRHKPLWESNQSLRRSKVPRDAKAAKLEAPCRLIFLSHLPGLVLYLQVRTGSYLTLVKSGSHNYAMTCSLLLFGFLRRVLTYPQLDEFSVYPRMALNAYPPSFHLLSSGVTGVGHHAHPTCPVRISTNILFLLLKV